MSDTPQPSPVDGITFSSSQPAPVQRDPSPAVPDSGAIAGAGTVSSFRGAFVILIVVGVVYAFCGIVLLAMFPRPDGSMANVQSIGTFLYGIGAVAWLLFALIGILRIASIKDHPRMKFFSSLRLAGITIPLIILSIAVSFLINREPTLRLEVIAPTNAADFVAPVSVTFGMDTALKVFAQARLKPLKYEWDYTGDGVTDQETFDPRSTYLVTKAGIVPVVASVTMTDGSVKKVSYRLLIPRVSFSLQPAQPIIDEPVTFSIEHMFPKTADTTAKLLMARWDFDSDGSVDLESDKLIVSYTYRKLGKVNVTVTMTNANQSQSTLQRTIEVVKQPEQPFAITLDTEPQTLLGPPPFGVLFSLKTKEPIASAAWDFGNQKTAEGLRVAQVFPAVGLYVVNVSVRSRSGAIAKLSKVVRVTNPLEIRDLSFVGTSVKNFVIEGEVPLIVDITPATQLPLISFSWDAQNATESLVTDKTLHAVYRDAGKFFIDLIGTDSDQNVFRKRLTVNAIPPTSFVSFSMDPPTPTAPASVIFDASDTFIPSGEEITGFEWDFGDSDATNASKFSGARVSHTFVKPQTYTITLTVRTTSGKTFSNKQTLTVKAPLTDACFLPSRMSGKAPLGVRFDAGCSTGDFASWAWNFGDASESDVRDPTHVFMNPGEYTVTLTATTGNGIKSTKSAIISVTE